MGFKDYLTEASKPNKKAKALVADIASFLKINYGDKGLKGVDRNRSAGDTRSEIDGIFPATKVAKFIAQKTGETKITKSSRWIDFPNGIHIQLDGSKGVSVLVPDKLK